MGSSTVDFLEAIFREMSLQGYINLPLRGKRPKISQIRY